MKYESDAEVFAGGSTEPAMTTPIRIVERLEAEKPKRYDLVTNYRCGSSIEELEPAEDGEWVRWETLLEVHDRIKLEHDVWDKKRIVELQTACDRVYALQRELDTLKAGAVDLSTAKLYGHQIVPQATMKLLIDRAERAEAKLDVATRQIADLKGYVQHKEDCHLTWCGLSGHDLDLDTATDSKHECTCGLDALKGSPDGR